MDGSTWINWIVELQAIAQAGLHYSKDPFDIGRFERVREISAEIMSKQSELPIETVKNLFCNESGYQTPKIDTRAAIFRDDKILLVKETLTNTWSLPGGWVDINESIKSNSIKEVKEEAGLDVMPNKLVAMQDRNKHNKPQYAYGICKVFIICDVISGSFMPNSETSASGFFLINGLPELANEKTTLEQIQMCFDAYHDNNWVAQFD